MNPRPSLSPSERLCTLTANSVGVLEGQNAENYLPGCGGHSEGSVTPSPKVHGKIADPFLWINNTFNLAPTSSLVIGEGGGMTVRPAGAADAVGQPLLEEVGGIMPGDPPLTIAGLPDLWSAIE